MSPSQREPGHLPERLRWAVRQPGHRAEVDHPEPSVGEQPEVARVRVGVQQPGTDGRRVVEQREQIADAVAVGLRTVRDDPGERCAAEPFGDDDLRRAGNHVRDNDLGVALVRRRERALRVGLQGVVELLGDAIAQFGQQGLDVQTGGEPAKQPGESGELGEVAHDSWARAGILDLDRYRTAIGPDSPVDLADACRGGGLIVELGEPFPPVPPELLG